MHLFITGTPIGNLNDMTFRAIDTLKSVDTILCEDTRTTRKLTNHFEISTPLRSYHDFNKEEIEDHIIEEMKTGKTFALVSDAGMPVVSDPGFELIERMQREKLDYVVIPSASAFTMSLVASGIPSYEFTYFGFLPKTGRKRKDKLTEVMEHPFTSVLYESPHKIKDTLISISSIDPERNVSVSREITKKFEQHERASAAEMTELLGGKIPLKGEFVIVVEGAPEVEETFDLPVNDHIEELIEEGMKPKQAIKTVADLRRLRKQDVYDEYHKN